jgi:hypothetical protein
MGLLYHYPFQLIMYSLNAAKGNQFACLKAGSNPQILPQNLVIVRRVWWDIPLTECSSGTVQQLSFGVSTTIELKNITATPDSTGILLSWNITALEAVIVWCSYIFDPNRSIKSTLVMAISGPCHYCIHWAIWSAIMQVVSRQCGSQFRKQLACCRY